MSQSKDDLIDFRLFLFHETEKAWLVGETPDRDKAFWLPKSQCTWEETGIRKCNMAVDDFGVPEWLCVEKELI